MNRSTFIRASRLGPSIYSGQATSTLKLSKAFTTELCRSIRPTHSFIKFVSLSIFLIGGNLWGMDSNRNGLPTIALKSDGWDYDQNNQKKMAHEHGWRLISFAREGNIQQTQRFLEMGVPADAKDEFDKDLDWTALIHAASFGHHEVCKMLIDAKAQINIKGKHGTNPLLEATMRGHKEVCQLLIEAKAPILAKYNAYKQDCTPLMVAAGGKHKEICILFVDTVLKPIKQKKAAATTFLGLKKFNRASCMQSNYKDEIRLIARQIFDPSEITKLFAEIETIPNNEMREFIRAHAQEQLNITPKTNQGGSNE